jgi:Holliday junction resolvase RusA-like endonuclease
MGRVQVNIEIPLTPPSANHYKIPTNRFQPDGRRIFKLAPEAKAWYDAVATFARGQSIAGDRLRVEFCVYLGKGERGDVDNFCKCILDGLVKAHVLATDDSVVEMHIYKERDRANPRTEILITEVEDGA